MAMIHTFHCQPIHRILSHCIWVIEDGQLALVLLSLDEFDFSQLNAHFMDSLEHEDIIGNVFCQPFAQHLTLPLDENLEIYNEAVANEDGLFLADINIKISGVKRENNNLYPIFIINYIEYI